MKVYRTSIMNMMDMGMYMCSMCMYFGANFSDTLSGDLPRASAPQVD